MYGTRPEPSPPRQWSVHAEFTISHPGANDPVNLPRTSTERDDDTGGVRMTYSWTANDGDDKPWAPPPPPPPDWCARGFQKGNLFFTSTPPSRLTGDVASKVHESSGYGSDVLSPNSLGGTLPRRPAQPYNRKCRSTCNITLSTNIGSAQSAPSEGSHSQCGRTQSLRCQTPSSSSCPNRYYGCGDPWCHHPRFNDEFAYSLGGAVGRISPVLESGEDSLGSGAPQKRDAAVQTFEMVDKCTSPFLRPDHGLRTRCARRKTEPSRRDAPCTSSASLTPDSLDSVKHGKLARKSPKPIKEASPADSLKKPRTVHIDVYCTGTELESDADTSSESESKSASTPQTVFESERVKVTHKKAGEAELPLQMRRPPVRPSDDDEEDDASTAYPSKMSSYSTIGDFSASVSSVPRSWTSYSMSSCAVPDDYDSVTNTSWKDTYSDVHSLADSKSSMVPRRLFQNASIDETPELDALQTPSVASLHPSDSFEYANSEDRRRIKRMEETWNNKTVAKAPDSDSDESDHSARGWTFVAPEGGAHTRRSPFTVVPGFCTESRSIAKKFGPVVSAMRKPGHHVGPAKNPDCLCSHCRSYWENGAGYRSRARSVGDPPSRAVTNWKEFLERAGRAETPPLPYTDF
ncbi:uncharacterized protein LOC132707809 [Cylas formicarius]|uniref:uncharacterized protein LOC132707809 n=1 Tax=Cylas formicarius TaxID=197179 RepID=UPI002958A036|nr:uncharacterized protein LOC132707809 [Cylas formicarius]